jgi:hypothetical protein
MDVVSCESSDPVWTFTLLVRSFRDDVLTFLSRDETVPADGESTPVFSR